MNIEDILIQSGDFPAGNIAGERKITTGDHQLLRNVGNAELFVIQWICNVEKRAEIGGEIRLIVYPSDSFAARFFTRITQDFQGQSLPDVGDSAFIRYGADLPPMPPSTSIQFRRHRFVVQLLGTDNDDPSFARSKLSREVLIRYAQLLDTRLMEEAWMNK